MGNVRQSRGESRLLCGENKHVVEENYTFPRQQITISMGFWGQLGAVFPAENQRKSKLKVNEKWQDTPQYYSNLGLTFPKGGY